MARLNAIINKKALTMVKFIAPLSSPSLFDSFFLFLSLQIGIIRQIDVNNVFLHCVIEEDVLMTQPLNFKHYSFLDYVCHLKKSINGLKQVPLALYSRFSTKLVTIGFVRSMADTSFYLQLWISSS